MRFLLKVVGDDWVQTCWLDDGTADEIREVTNRICHEHDWSGPVRVMIADFDEEIAE